MNNNLNKRQLKKIKPYTKTWERIADDMARSYAPKIYPCKRCGYPCIHGYICRTCGCSNPSNPDFDEELDVIIVTRIRK